MLLIWESTLNSLTETASRIKIRKETDVSDQRYTKLYLTEKGQEKADLLFRRLSQSDAIITEKIGADKEKEVIALLTAICTAMEEEL